MVLVRQRTGFVEQLKRLRANHVFARGIHEETTEAGSDCVTAPGDTGSVGRSAIPPAGGFYDECAWRVRTEEERTNEELQTFRSR